MVTTLSTPSFNISSNYTFKTGQENTFYDHGRIKRKSNSTQPSKQLKIYFSSASYSSTDDGDITTVNSYSQLDYTNDIKNVNVFRTSDIIDIRPRVSDHTVSESSRSPLEFFGRAFDGSGQSATNPLASDDAILTDIPIIKEELIEFICLKKVNSKLFMEHHQITHKNQILLMILLKFVE